MHSRRRLFRDHTFLANVLALISAQDETGLSHFGKLVPCFSYSSQASQICSHSFPHVLSRRSQPRLPNSALVDGFMNESCIFTTGAEGAGDSAMLTIGALAPIIPFAIFIIRHRDAALHSRERHIMSSRLFVFRDFLAGARRANGSLVTVVSDRYASRVCLVPNALGLAGWYPQSQHVGFCGGYGFQSTTHWTRSIFESDESTLFPSSFG
jgi:hypothetical protein